MYSRPNRPAANRRCQQQPSKLKVAGSNPAGVANHFNDLAPRRRGSSCRNLSQTFLCCFNELQWLLVIPCDTRAARAQYSNSEGRAVMNKARNPGTTSVRLGDHVGVKPAPNVTIRHVGVAPSPRQPGGGAPVNPATSTPSQAPASPKPSPKKG
jgi:hypothetical protein